MKKKLTVERVMMAYGVLSVAKYGGLDADGQVKALKNLKAMRPTAESYNKFVEDSDTRLKSGSISNDALYKAIKEENAREVELDIEPFTQDEIRKLWAGNQLTGAQMLALDDAVTEKK